MIISSLSPKVQSPDQMKWIAESVIGPINWETGSFGVCACPGESLHSSATKKRDCLFYFDGVPTIFCQHKSCATAVELANNQVRSAIGKARVASGCIDYRPTIQEQLQRGERLNQKREDEQLVKRSRESLPLIIEEYSCPTADLWEDSPTRLMDRPVDEWPLILNLFNSSDVIWIGDIYDSAKEDQDDLKKDAAREHFKTAGEWLDSSAPPAGPLICPCTFKAGSYSRSKANVESQPFLVVESDVLSHEHFLGVVRFLEQRLRLRAVVDTAGKSLHAWFDYPRDEQFPDLPSMLEGFQCDTAMLRPSQAVRFPGARRYKKDHGSTVFMGVQSLLYLDL
jgi:hypothetical protein